MLFLNKQSRTEAVRVQQRRTARSSEVILCMLVRNLGRGVRQGDTISPKLFTAALENVFRKLDWSDKGISIDGERLNNLRFADDIVLISDNVDDMLNAGMATTRKYPRQRSSPVEMGRRHSANSRAKMDGRMHGTSWERPLPRSGTQ
ncbi:hypothetical protein ABMA27_004554 [Loxostege sticticalis]|uniref:Reverse transcriptase domain-containing protein n=1 Tax=Loxostege sticticalis TaxID=481309 RepID=A0ABR3HP04_LOXSC